MSTDSQTKTPPGFLSGDPSATAVLEAPPKPSAPSSPPEEPLNLEEIEFPPSKPEFLPQVVVERIVATIACLLCLPLMILIGLYIKLRSPGPVIFRQDRVGKGGKLFRFIKFRTMYVDARERFPELYAYKYDPDDLSSFRFKVENDPRVAPGCMWLRSSTLDELPNFWNVMTGSMALTGPRPEIPQMLPYYKGEMLEKFSVRPGITGVAQASGRGNLNFYESVQCDLENVRKQSPWFSIKLLFKTAWKVIKREGAY